MRAGPASSSRFLDPHVLAGIAPLELRAKAVVEGLLAGLHRSPFKGFSVEFSQYRQYSPWDDPRRMDWKVYGRSDRYFIKEFEAETNLRAYILLDTSASMGYQSEGTPFSKLEYASTLAASLAHLMLKQRDQVGLAAFHQNVHTWVPLSSRMSHWQLLLHTLGECRPSLMTKIAQPLHEAAERLKKRGLVILLTDGLDDPEYFEKGLQHLKFLKHDVIVFQILDPAELIFPFQGLVEIEEMETHVKRLIHADASREEYQKNFRVFIEQYYQICSRFEVDHLMLTTTDPLDVALSAYLAKRAASGKA